jgi:SAM-dependent methyltransferase
MVPGPRALPGRNSEFAAHEHAMLSVRCAAREIFLFFAGLVFLALAKSKNLLQGYTSPKTFELTDIGRCVSYDLKVVDEWLAHLESYASGKVTLRDKAVVELGPGSDLGAGLYLLARGAASYGACDVHDLIKSVPRDFYTALLDRILQRDPSADRTFLEAQIAGALHSGPTRLRMVVREDFDLVAAFGTDSADLVFSQAAFEHFDDLDRTVAQLTRVCRRGATIVAEIDMKTHSRWIRDKDPNNIYRYPNLLYRLFWFRGTPNRLRPYQYREVFERHGWSGVTLTRIERTSPEHPNGHWLLRRFRDPYNEMESLSVVLCAMKTASAAH